MNATIAVDLGNSAAKWAVDDQAAQRISLRSTDWLERLICEAQAQAGNQLCDWRIASVNRPITKLLTGRLQDEQTIGSVRTISSGDVPIVAKVANPDRVGIDRLLASWMASQLYPGQAAIVVDAGSAITIDFVNENAEFLGGVILPGIALQFDSLARGTDALPSIEIPLAEAVSSDTLPIPATDTVTAIRSGILLGTAAAIDGLIQRYLTRGPHRQCKILYTGGDAPLLLKLSTCQHELFPRLVLDAIGLLP